jgi:lipopolysaccharide cholinephosphotransferase
MAEIEMETQTIETSGGKFNFQPQPLYYGRKVIDKVNALENLLSLKDVFDRSGISFGLIYGTLLGAVRDGDFIDWDEDIDIFILDEQRDAFHSALWDLRKIGLELIRRENDLYSIMRKDDYIDIYVFQDVGATRRCNADIIAARHLAFEDSIDFHGVQFAIPADHERLLQTLYGGDWRTPRQNRPAQPYTPMRKFKNFVRKKIPKIYELLKAVR